MSGKPARKERGVALLVVLILLVMMSALAAKISQQFCRHLQKRIIRSASRRCAGPLPVNRRYWKTYCRKRPVQRGQGCRREVTGPSPGNPRG